MSRPIAIFAAVLILLIPALTADAQPAAARRLATIASLRQFPGYFHLQNVLLRGEFAEANTRVMFRSDDQEMRVTLADGVSASDGPVEIRAQMIDVGRMDPSDPRATPFAQGRDAERWPRPGEELVLNVTGVTAAPPATTPTIRAIALEPWKFAGQRVTIVGQFRGRNLLGDLPAAPAKSRYDFVLRSADAAIWVTNLRPRARNVELRVDARMDTGRWVQVTGTVAHERGLVMLDGTTFAEAREPEATAAEAEEPAAPVLPPRPLDVVFSSPTPDETDVPATSSVRIQFSRELNPGTIAGQIRVGILGGPVLEFSQSYDAANRAIEIRFAQPLAPLSTVRVELLDGLRAFDGGTFQPWSLTFSVAN